ncbi:MAG TPA: transketolase [Thermodesulfobacteriota bacterium]|nr:transketolase [Deltaproteobacteria bacterium]HNR12008.1 transketolase [Thermodesulfobacteriota bacterium]HNU72150.1 transketolase [Thermodesulfobacteriota bacterium]HOC37890.1 transketolase [Thermodesulfobacteriota bacterium]
MISAEKVTELEGVARDLRGDILRMLTKACSGHTGGSLSAVEILTALYFHTLRHDPKNPSWPDRDRFVLSKGHGAPVLYAALARCGYFDRAVLTTLRELGSILQGHPDMKSTPGVDISTGSLGQGLSLANGMALALRLDNRPSRVYAVLGDGEIQEGQVWEAAMAAAHYRLDNLCAIIDNNGLQIDGPVEKIMSLGSIADKWASFGWKVFCVDGHSFPDLIGALDQTKSVKEQPSVIVARTLKGKGCSFCEGKVEYHGVAPSAEELECALKELGCEC